MIMKTFREFLKIKEELWQSKGLPRRVGRAWTVDLYNSSYGGGGGSIPVAKMKKMKKN